MSANDDPFDPPLIRELETPVEVDSADVKCALGEGIDQILDPSTWRAGDDLRDVFARLEREVADAVRQEDEVRRTVRKVIFPSIGSRHDAPPNAGVFAATAADIRQVQHSVLFNGGLDACDGTVVVHDHLPVTIIQLGACLVSYEGDQGSWTQRLFRRDIHSQGGDPVEEALAILQRRQIRAGFDLSGRKDVINELVRRGVMSYMERAVLVQKSSAPWRMGHSHPAPYELITGSGSKEMLDKSLEIIRALVLDHKRFVFVPSAPADRAMLTIGNALRPLEFAIVETAERRMEKTIKQGKYWPDRKRTVEDFYGEVAPKIVVGVYRTSQSTPPYLFYAHVDHAEEAVLIAMADSALQAHRGFPILIDIANNACQATLGTDGFTSLVQSAYAATGNPLNYLGERETRG
jgi:hypothetical protein